MVFCAAQAAEILVEKLREEMPYSAKALSPLGNCGEHTCRLQTIETVDYFPKQPARL
jgi:hypothetical protein